MIDYVDIIVGLAWGDEGKGKISSAKAPEYNMVCRWNGGPNAGHTVYIDDKKYKTHLIPSGVFHNKPSIIGPNCVVNLTKFNEELNYLSDNGFNPYLVKIHPHAHMITDEHINYDINVLKSKLGTTGQGIAPCYTDKAARVGLLAKDYISPKFIWDGNLQGKILCEGAQSVWLDINHGNYPYVTSSETLPYGACSLGFSPKKIRDIYGVAKIYDTKSGVDPLFPESLWDNEELNSIIEEGQEYGSTTGRKRIVNYLNVRKLLEAINLSGCNKIIINKCDVFEKLKINKLLINEVRNYSNFEELKLTIMFYILNGNTNGITTKDIVFSGDVAKI
jgi:adenylosuccinate synthase